MSAQKKKTPLPPAEWRDLPTCPGLWLWTMGGVGKDGITVALVRDKDGVLVTAPYSAATVFPGANLRMWMDPRYPGWQGTRWYGPIPEDK